MNSSQVLRPVSLFFSYSHADTPIRDELEKHLATLKRLGLIETWHDRRIGPGDEWAAKIDQHLENADIILLLISPDFIASNYCYDLEATRALERHKRDEATVIPVVLRPVDFHGLPFAGLQMLPNNARPVVTDPSRATVDRGIDIALREVAEGVRAAAEKVIDRRLRRFNPGNKPNSLQEPRTLEAALAHEISVGAFREVVVRIPLESSVALGSILSLETASSYSCGASDVRFSTFQAKYSVTATDELISPEYRLTIYAPSLVYKEEEKRFPLEPMRDSSIFTFFVKAENEGEHRVRVNLYCRNWHVSETLLKTSATEYKPGPGTGRSVEPDLVASVELNLRAIAKAASSMA